MTSSLPSFEPEAQRASFPLKVQTFLLWTRYGATKLGLFIFKETVLPTLVVMLKNPCTFDGGTEEIAAPTNPLGPKSTRKQFFRY